jgi:DNA-binding CsgD family transcriptional regulator
MRERVGKLLEQGLSRQKIARQLGIDPSTVTRHARFLGYPDGHRRPSATDSGAVQAFYDEGHSIDECCARFGCSYGAWDKATVRGDLVTRPRGNGNLGFATRDRVEALLADGLTGAEIGKQLGISKSTVAFHCRRLGKRADPRFARRYDWSAVQSAIDREGLSMRACIDRFGFSRATWFEAVKRRAIVPRPHEIPLEDLLVVGRDATSRAHLKSRLIKAGLKENRCEECGITEWRGKPLSMELHHVNGDGRDNRLENLRLLCGNCHAQTDNWGGRGRKRKRQAC